MNALKRDGLGEKIIEFKQNVVFTSLLVSRGKADDSQVRKELCVKVGSWNKKEEMFCEERGPQWGKNAACPGRARENSRIGHCLSIASDN